MGIFVLGMTYQLTGLLWPEGIADEKNTGKQRCLGNIGDIGGRDPNMDQGAGESGLGLPSLLRSPGGRVTDVGDWAVYWCC